MMTPNCAGQKRQRLQRYSTAPLPIWQRLVLGGYSALFGLFLPLICWGAAAEPGHPHRYPHFVFAEPQRNPVAPSPTVSHATMHGMSASSVHEAENRAKTPAICALAPDGAIAGRATPTLLLFSLLLLALLGDWLARWLDGAHFALWRRPQFPKTLVWPVSLPPPRLSLFPV